MATFIPRPTRIEAFRFGYHDWPSWFAVEVSMDRAAAFAIEGDEDPPHYAIIMKDGTDEGIRVEKGEWIVRQTDGKMGKCLDIVFRTAFEATGDDELLLRAEMLRAAMQALPIASEVHAGKPELVKVKRYREPAVMAAVFDIESLGDDTGQRMVGLVFDCIQFGKGEVMWWEWVLRR